MPSRDMILQLCYVLRTDVNCVWSNRPISIKSSKATITRKEVRRSENLRSHEDRPGMGGVHPTALMNDWDSFDWSPWRKQARSKGDIFPNSKNCLSTGRFMGLFKIQELRYPATVYTSDFITPLCHALHLSQNQAYLLQTEQRCF